ncbi:MAG: zf-HC2 domain-containing protein [Anaerolineae bacterium]|nr:zf-HC2 domain-containing protein [Anaerolineae bacterium]
MDHITDLLGPYLDGELRNGQVVRIERHLETCQSCQDALAEHHKLSALLHAVPPAVKVKSASQFAADVGLLMQRQPQPSAAQRALITGWKAIPVGLAGLWAVVQAALIVTTIFFAISDHVPGMRVLRESIAVRDLPTWSSSIWSILQPSSLQVIDVVTEILQHDLPLELNFSVAFIIPLFFGTMYVCWLASWWAVKQHTALSSGELSN